METDKVKISKKTKNQDNVLSTLANITKGYRPNEFIQTEWTMQDGLYKQYSAFEDDEPCVAGNNSSLYSL